MTSLKNYTGDEIAAAFAERLKDAQFIGLYRTAADAWWTKGPTATAFKQEVDGAKTAGEIDAIRNRYLAGGTLTSALGAEGVDDFQPLIEYADARAGSLSQVADDQAASDKPVIPPTTEDPIQGIKMTDRELADMTGIKPQIKTDLDIEELMREKPPAAEDGSKACGCPKGAACDHGVSTAAIDFANRHLAKIASALDAVGFTGMADDIDGLMNRFAAKKAKKHRGRSYSEWVKHFNAHGKEVGAKFRETFKGALDYAKKKKNLSGDKAEEYAMRTALDKMPKSYFKEPGPEHGPGKSGKKVASELNADDIMVLAAKKHHGRSYSEWVKHFNAHGKEVGAKFRETFKGVLDYAKKKKNLSGDKAEEYAMRTALDKMPKSYFKEPGPEHGPGKSGKKVAK